MRIEMPEIRKKYDREFREGAVRIVEETKTPVAQVARDLGVNEGTLGTMLPIFNTASEVGYGAVIATLPAFAIIRDAVLNVSSNPLVSEAVPMNVLAGNTGSSSGGLSIALQTLGADYLKMAVDAGISPDLMHRVAVMSAGVFDTLPHCGAIITLLSICGLTHRQSYLNIAMMTIVMPLIALAAVIALGTAFGSF